MLFNVSKLYCLEIVFIAYPAKYDDSPKHDFIHSFGFRYSENK